MTILFHSIYDDKSHTHKHTQTSHNPSLKISTLNRNAQRRMTQYHPMLKCFIVMFSKTMNLVMIFAFKSYPLELSKPVQFQPKNKNFAQAIGKKISKNCIFSIWSFDKMFSKKKKCSLNQLAGIPDQKKKSGFN